MHAAPDRCRLRAARQLPAVFLYRIAYDFLLFIYLT